MAFKPYFLLPILLFSCSEPEPVPVEAVLDTNNIAYPSEAIDFTVPKPEPEKVRVLEKGWEIFEEYKRVDVDSSVHSFTVDDFAFTVVWGKDPEVAKKMGDYTYEGQILEMKVLKNNKQIQVFKSLENGDGFEKIYINFHDYNFDGNLDFAIKSGVRSGKFVHESFYLFQPNIQQFKYIPDWDWIKVDIVNTKKKLFKTVMDGNCCEGDIYTYKPNKNRLVEVEKEHIGPK